MSEPLLWRIAAIGESSFFRPSSNSGCVSLQALLSGPWRSATLFSYTWNLGLLTQLCPRLENSHLQVTLVSGRNITIDKLNARSQRYHHMKHLQVSTRAGESALLFTCALISCFERDVVSSRSPDFLPLCHLTPGSHHVKMMLFEFEKGLRVVITTANLSWMDWNDPRQQGVWYQDFPYNTSKRKRYYSILHTVNFVYLTKLLCSQSYNHARLQFTS
jgi:Tyrosyl-DNA phosphodiesterase